jgi:hypothetical protein
LYFLDAICSCCSIERRVDGSRAVHCLVLLSPKPSSWTAFVAARSPINASNITKSSCLAAGAVLVVLSLKLQNSPILSLISQSPNEKHPRIMARVSSSPTFTIFAPNSVLVPLSVLTSMVTPPTSSSSATGLSLDRQSTNT